MKTRLLMAVILLLGVALGWGLSRYTGTATMATAAAEKTLYTCGMHPQIVQDHPGNCPICGMKLTPIRKQENGANTAADANAIIIDPVTVQNMGIRTALVTRGPLRRVIRAVGNIETRENALTDVTTKFKGWIEKLYVDTTGQQVRRGEPLFDIYSPELFSAQTEYLLTLNVHDEALRQSATRKLKFFDFTDAQIAELEQTRQPQKTVRVYAPADGFVIEKMAVAGQMVEAGMRIYQLANLDSVWVQAQIYERDLAFVKVGQEAAVTLSYLPGREFRGRVAYVYPNVDEKTRTVRVRLELGNPDLFLKPGMFTEVQLVAELESAALLVPDMAVLRSGEQNTVFVVLDGGRFEPRTVKLGATTGNDMIQILDGLNEGERIVTSGQFMLDSESQLREAIQKMLKPDNAAAPTAKKMTTLYTCPMVEHAEVVNDKPGPCPKCGMDLVPTSTVAHGKQAEAAWRKQHPTEKK
ncbi:MAG: efflux RND transporter periplasmic adaptor subunit [Verrucomicrobia bacterium]|nr:MAG: efflux RND transporter periplasmic adaptor subunit [Verrucomicrobiota bacterium]